MGAAKPPLKKNQRFGYLTVKNPKYDDKYRVLVECDCTNQLWVHHLKLRAGKPDRCMSCSRSKKRNPYRMEVSRGEIYDPWEVLEDAKGSKARVKVRCIGCEKKTTRKLLGIVEGEHSCLTCVNKSRGMRVVIFNGKTISLQELMRASESLTIVATAIQATPKENLREQVNNYIFETGQITQTPQALIVQIREGQ